MARAKVHIDFFSEGFAAVLGSPGVQAKSAAVARQAAQLKESQTGVPYDVQEKSARWKGYSRPSYLVRPAGDERIEGLTHEQWMEEVWPRVGGPKWRPRG